MPSDNQLHQTLQELLYQARNLEDELDTLPEPVPLPQQGSWPASRHRIDRRSLLAIVAAVAANRPLLIKGEPGVGKSQLARAAAALLGRAFISTVIQPHTDYQELLWNIDYTARLGDAQLLSLIAAHTPSKTGAPEQTRSSDHLQQARAQLALQHYLQPGPLWWAYHWEDAARQAAKAGPGDTEPESEDGQQAANARARGVVLLVDEIDKADMALANGLLEALGNGSFEVQPLKHTVRGPIPPLVVITSNRSRELPKAFIRRCVSFTLALPEAEAELKDYFIQVGRDHFPGLAPAVVATAAERILAHRRETDSQSEVRTGLAELVDLLRALNNLPLAEREQACEDLHTLFYKQSD